MKKPVLVGALLGLAVTALYLAFNPTPAPAPEAATPSSRVEGPAPPLAPRPSTAAQTTTPPVQAVLRESAPPQAPGPDAAAVTDPVPPAPRKAVVAISASPEFTDLPPAAVMENVRTVFRQFASRFGSNPVGTNLEITRALNGENPKQTQYLRPEDGLRTNVKGEMIDPWDTPFFFHQLSGTEMEIHSAGPDRVLWTADDLVTK